MVSASPFVLSTCLAAAASPASAFQVPTSAAAVGRRRGGSALALASRHEGRSCEEHRNHDFLRADTSRRSFVAAAAAAVVLPTAASAEEESMYAPKFVQTYDDFTSTSEGWSYKDVKIGKDIGGELRDGDRVVFDWSGYTIGYFGRPFEAKGGPQGGAFDKDLNYFRCVLGDKTLVPGLECALRSMKPGGIRQVIVPYGPLSYPPEDKEHDAVGPKPTTFSGMRALNFVLENPRVDRTLLFNVKLVRVDRSDGKGGFIRG